MPLTLAEYARNYVPSSMALRGDPLVKYLDRRRVRTSCIWGLHGHHTRVDRTAFCDSFNGPVRLTERSVTYRCATGRHRYHRTLEAALPCLREHWSRINGPLGRAW